MSAQVTAYSILIVTMLLAAAVGTIVAKKVNDRNARIGSNPA